MLTNLDILFRRLGDPEYLYLLLEPLPLFGLLFGLIFFCIGLYMDQEKTRIVSLILLAMCCFSVVPYIKYRDKAMPRVAEIIQSPQRIKDQTKLRKQTTWVYYVVAITALVTLIGGGKFGSLGNYAVLAFGFLALVFSLWLHMKEAEVYHPNIRKAVISKPRT